MLCADLRRNHTFEVYKLINHVRFINANGKTEINPSDWYLGFISVYRQFDSTLLLLQIKSNFTKFHYTMGRKLMSSAKLMHLLSCSIKLLQVFWKGSVKSNTDNGRGNTGGGCNPNGLHFRRDISRQIHSQFTLLKISSKSMKNR